MRYVAMELIEGDLRERLGDAYSPKSPRPRDSTCRRPGQGPRRRHRPSRSQARERHDHRGRARQDPRLRRRQAGPQRESTPFPDLTTMTRMTLRGRSFGTVSYMSPEQAAGGLVDHQSDQFSLARCSTKCCAGSFPSGHLGGDSAERNRSRRPTTAEETPTTRNTQGGGAGRRSVSGEGPRGPLFDDRGAHRGTAALRRAGRRRAPRAHPRPAVDRGHPGPCWRSLAARLPGSGCGTTFSARWSGTRSRGSPNSPRPVTSTRLSASFMKYGRSSPTTRKSARYARPHHSADCDHHRAARCRG